MIGKYPSSSSLWQRSGSPLAPPVRKRGNNPRVREAEATADAAGESRVEMTEQHQSWRAATNPGRQRTQRRGDRPRRRGGDDRPHRSGQRRAGATYPWHIHRGECGDAQPPVVGSADAYPPIQVGDDGGWRRGGDDHRDPRPGRRLHRERAPVADATRHDRLVRGAREVLVAGVLSGHPNRRKDQSEVGSRGPPDPAGPRRSSARAWVGLRQSASAVSYCSFASSRRPTAS